MNITRTFRHWRLVSVCVLSLLVSAAGLALPPGKADVPSTPGTWAECVWQSALVGDFDGLNKLFDDPPAVPEGVGETQRFRDALRMHRTNSDKARTKQVETRGEALTKMRDFLAKEDLAQALRSAVEVQTLSDNLEDAFADPDINKIVAWAESQIPKVRQEQDWLQAQELLYFTRTLYEDTSRVADYQKYDDELELVNRRVSLLAQYAPKRLHELRNLKAKRMGEEPKDEFNAASAVDMQERIEGVTPAILKASLRTAAAEHIETSGWRPLLKGGLDELKILATTTSLDETFPNLANAEHVGKWVAHIDSELAALEKTPDDDLDHSTCTRMIDDLLRVNQETITLPPGVLYREFGDGATFELDPFSEIIWPDKLSRFKQAVEGAFVGVGILIRHNDTQDIVVVNPLEGTPAYFGGVKPEDLIIEVHGQSTVGWSLNDAVDRITGDPGTEVKLTLRRKDVADPIVIPLTRQVIKLRSVMGWWKRGLDQQGTPQWDWYVDPISRIAYIKLTQFTEETYNDLKQAWREITADGEPNGLILDLRYNPGGLLTSAVEVSNLFVKEGVIVSGEDKDGAEAWKDQRANPKHAKLDGVSTVVLINQGSASASEIVAGCLQAHGAAVIVGERSFGKGSVQTVHNTASNSRLKLTTQYYRLPATLEQLAAGEKGRLVHKRPGATTWGVDPDILVKMTPAQVKDSLDLRQDADIIPQDATGKILADSPDRPDVTRLLTEGMDPQLETALLILQARAIGNENGATKHASRE